MTTGLARVTGDVERRAETGRILAVLVEVLGQRAREAADDLLEGVGRVVVLAGQDRPLARDEQLGFSDRTPGADEARESFGSAATRTVTDSPSSADSDLGLRQYWDELSVFDQLGLLHADDAQVAHDAGSAPARSRSLFWRASWIALSMPTTCRRDDRQGDDGEPLRARQ